MEKNCLLIGINAKYIHTNLAIRYLKNYCKAQYTNIKLMEFSINDNIENILKEIYSKDIDIYGFSCYIWNIEIVLKLCSSLKKLNTGCVIILGGPEVSFEADELMKQHAYVDYIVRGEGEVTFQELLMHLKDNELPISTIMGITYRADMDVKSTPERPLLKSLDEVPFPYGELHELNNKIIYYETTRGCPFNCQYCLSSTIHGVRFLSMDRIKKEIKFFADNNVKQVKLVDRTFNCNKQHSLAIIKYILELNCKTNFHFEIGADLLDDEMIAVLSMAPKDMFQFEIGVQSTNKTALREISREMKLDKLKHNVAALQQARNSHMHLDLIAGLPYEDFISFGNSFDEVHQLMPDMLQLGFLKVLKGSGLKYNSSKYGLEYNSFAPYEVLKTNWISYEELIKLKEVEHVLELYYNSGRFYNSLRYIFQKHYTSYFSFYMELAEYWKCSSLFAASQGTRELYNILWRFAEAMKLNSIALRELIKLDWLMYYNNGNMPQELKRYDHGSVKKALQEYIRGNDALAAELSINESVDPRDLPKLIAYEVFYTDVLRNPEAEEENVVFYTKNSKGEIRTTSRVLADITT